MADDRLQQGHHADPRKSQLNNNRHKQHLRRGGYNKRLAEEAKILARRSPIYPTCIDCIDIYIYYIYIVYIEMT